ncbi:MAG: hypothetical protein AAB526_03675 [Patescibacteria group bacterium]
MNPTLNLISPKIKRELKIKQVCKIIKIFLVAIFLMNVFAAIILLSAEFVLQSFFIKKMERNFFVFNNNYQNLNKKIKILNQNFNEINTIQEKFIPWSKILIYFTQSMPSDIKIYSIKNVNNSTKMKVFAVAKNREALLKIKEEFKKNPAFINLEFPFSNLALKENINFQFETKIDIGQIKP